MEKAIASFQAMLEFNCFCPKELLDETSQLKRFETFWESEAPRIGDEGAVGWANWELNPEQTPRPEPKKGSKQSKSSKKGSEVRPALEPKQDEESKLLYVGWLEEEESREQRQWMPCRPLMGVGIDYGEDIEQDPDKVVLFDGEKFH
jgi:hypothetical protein